MVRLMKFFVGYSLNSKAFRVSIVRTRIVEKTCYIRLVRSTHNVVGTQSNGFVGTKASNNAGQARKETEPDDESKPSSDDGKKVDEDSRKDSEGINQEKEDNVNNTNNVKFIKVKTASTPIETQKPLLKDKNGEEVDITSQSKGFTLHAVKRIFSLDRKSITGGCQFSPQGVDLYRQCIRNRQLLQFYNRAEYVVLQVAVDKLLDS
ncbi:hypothetical protein Tco_0472904 [Tanacetum coccineum]